MANLTNEKKKEWAKTLYLKESMTQAEIADKVGVSKQTMVRWVRDGKWETFKVSLLTSNEEHIRNWQRQILSINEAINEREEGKRYATPSEGDTILKLSKSIKNLQAKLGIAEKITAGMDFNTWLKKVDFEKAKDFTNLYDAYLRESM